MDRTKYIPGLFVLAGNAYVVSQDTVPAADAQTITEEEFTEARNQFQSAE